MSAGSALVGGHRSESSLRSYRSRDWATVSPFLVTNPGQPQFRRLHALLLCVLWVAGFEVGPGLHVAAHDWLEHHHHGSSSHVEVAEREEHGHDGHGHGHGHGHDGHGHGHGHEGDWHEVEVEFVEPLLGSTDLLAETGRDAVVRCADDFGHGAHSLAHRAVAAFPASPPWPSVAVASWVPLTRAERSVDVIRSRAPRCARARGPPVVSPT
jgi:hypothetical protein